jgi:hypothetical protein
MTLFLAIFSLITSFQAHAWEIEADSLALLDDGTTLITRPHIQEDRRKNLALNSSHLPTLCKLFGLQGLITAEGGTTLDTDTVGIESNRSLIHPSSGSQTIEKIVCASNGKRELTRLSETFASIRENTDQTVTLLGIEFGSSSGEKFSYSSMSHKDGLCRLYGYEHATQDPIFTRVGRKSKPMITLFRDGVIGQFETTENSVTSIQCARRLPYQLRNALDLEQLSPSLEELAFAVKPLYSTFLKDLSFNLRAKNTLAPWKRGRILAVKMLGPDHYRNFAIYLFLESFLHQLDSTWFESKVTPVLELRLNQIAALSGWHGLNDLARNPETIEAAMFVLVSALKALKPDVNDPVKASWINKMIATSGQYLSSNQTALDLEKWISVWNSGEIHRAAWIGTSQIHKLASQIETAGEWLESCHL